MSQNRTFNLNMSHENGSWEIRTSNNEGYNQIDRHQITDDQALHLAKTVGNEIHDQGRTHKHVKSVIREHRGRLKDELDRLRDAQVRIAVIEKILGEEVPDVD